MRTTDKTLLILGGGVALLLTAWLLHGEWSDLLFPSSSDEVVGTSSRDSAHSGGPMRVLDERAPDDKQPRQRPIPRPIDRDEGPVELRGALVGRVFASDQPVADASVIVSPGPRDYIGELPATVVSPRRGTTDSNGFFLVEDLPGGSGYEVVVRHPDYVAVQLRGVRVSPFETTDLGSITFESGTQLLGKVVDPNDAPVSNAELVFHAASKRPGPFAGRESDPGTDQRTTSDAEGTFQLDHLGPANYVIHVTATGFAPWIRDGFRIDRHARDGELLIRLKPALELVGRVTDSGGRPIEGAELIAQSRRPGEDGGKCEETTRSDSEGVFRFKQLSPGVYWVRAIADGYLIGAIHQVEPGADDVEIRLERTGIVRGRVRHADGSPVTAFTLKLESRIEDPSTFLASGDPQDEQYFENSDGTFAYTCRKSGTFRLVSYGSDHADTPSETFEIDKSGEIDGLEIVARTGGNLEGLVLDSAGDPISGALVRLRDKNANEKGLGELFESAFMTPGRTRNLQVRSDAEGKYVLSHVAPSDYKVQIIHPSFSEQWLRNVSVSEGETTRRDIGLIRGGRVIGVATDPKSGEILPQAIVMVTSLSGGNQVRVLADADGRFEIRNLPPGSYRLVRGEAADPLSILGSPSSISFDVIAGTEIDLGQL